MKITKDIMERYARGLATSEEREMVELWLKQDEEEDLPAVEQEDTRIDRVWDDLSKTIREDSQDQYISNSESYAAAPKRLGYFPSVIGIAASLLLVTLAAVYLFKKQDGEEAKSVALVFNTVYTKSGEHKSVNLPDGTVVNLNAGSELKFPAEFDTKERRVELKGEAFFSVTKDAARPFIILTDSSYTQVLGTRFNLKAYAGEKTSVLTVEEGKVRFGRKNNTTDRLVVTAGQQIVISPGQPVALAQADAHSALAWKANTFIMENETLADVAVRMERWYGIKVTIESAELRNLTVTGTYKNPSLEKILTGLSYTADIRYNVNGKTVVIY